jgi:hypothetical protein
MWQAVVFAATTHARRAAIVMGHGRYYDIAGRRTQWSIAFTNCLWFRDRFRTCGTSRGVDYLLGLRSQWSNAFEYRSSSSSRA